MSHVNDDDLHRLETLLNELRAIDGLRQGKRRTFTRRSKRMHATHTATEEH